MKAVLLSLVLILAGCGSTAKNDVLQRPDQPDVVSVTDEDAEMNAAIAEAQRTLPDFLTQLKSPKNKMFSLKVKMPTADGGAEHIWVSDVAYKGGKFSGLLDNEPVDLPGKRRGDPVSFTEKDVTDWLIMGHKGNMSGGFTTAVLERREKQNLPDSKAP